MTVALPAALNDQFLNQMIIFNQLYESKDWEGILQLESTGNRHATIIKNYNPSEAGMWYYNLGFAHKELGREGGIDRAIACFQKGIEIAKKASNEPLQAVTTWYLPGCYVIMGRIEEAMDVHKSLVADIGKEHLMPDYVLGFTDALNTH